MATPGSYQAPDPRRHFNPRVRQFWDNGNLPRDMSMFAEDVQLWANSLPGDDYNTISDVNLVPPQDLYRGKTIIDTTTMKQLVYYGKTTGWLPPWDQPWGQVAAVNSTSTQGVIALADITSLSVAVTVPCANRKYKASMFVAASTTVATDLNDFIITDGANVAQVGGYLRVAPNTTAVIGFSIGTGNFSPPSGALTIKGRAQRATGTGTISMAGTTFAHTLILEDIGPNGTPPTA